MDRHHQTEDGPLFKKPLMVTLILISGQICLCRCRPIFSETLISFSVRQKYLEDAVRAAISELDTGVVKAPAKLIDYRISKSSQYPIMATIEYEGKPVEVSW
jgi:hypothetical protein